jgi:regulator of protease activity HflC (stomatin/prohibitin superfamily)
MIPLGIIIGLVAWFLVRYLFAGLYTVDQNERAVKTRFGRAERLAKTTLEDPFAEYLQPEERARYSYPQVRVIPPGGPYFKWPWERVYKVSVATQTMNMALDLEDPRANRNGTMLEAVTKDQLNIGLTGQIRYRVCERNLYAYLFGVKQPIIHVMGYFVSILRERIANFEAPNRAPLLPVAAAHDSHITQLLTDTAPLDSSIVTGVSINDLRKNLRDLNELMDRECLSSEARYGITFDASLITGIDPPHEVESALAAINTAHNQVSSDISLAQAAADQKIVQSRRAVEIETLKAQAEVEPLKALAAQLGELKRTGPESLATYVRNVRLNLFSQAQRIIMEVKHD